MVITMALKQLPYTTLIIQCKAIGWFELGERRIDAVAGSEKYLDSRKG